MLAALVAMSFIAGLFAGVIILAMIFVYLVNHEKDETLEEKLIAVRESTPKVGPNPFVPAGPILS